MSQHAERGSVLVFGSNGQIGWELQRTLAPLGRIIPIDRSMANIENPEAIRDVIRRTRPSVIVNAAAYTSVDRAESERDLAIRINGVAPGVMADEAKRAGALMVHYSTDYVFDGSASRPYTEDDRAQPVTAYGVSKLAGDEAVLASGAAAYVLRIAWVYAKRGNNFLRTIQRLASERDELRIVADQHGSPTWAHAIAEATAHVISVVQDRKAKSESEPPPGVYHLAAPNHTTWHGFAAAILSAMAADGQRARPKLTPILTADYPTPARRPQWSVLDSEKLRGAFGVQLPSWESQLAMCLAD
jgi:dTDP-4-dehydrorhamnose reductase